MPRDHTINWLMIEIMYSVEEHVNLLLENDEVTCLNYYGSRYHAINLLKVRKV